MSCARLRARFGVRNSGTEPFVYLAITTPPQISRRRTSMRTACEHPRLELSGLLRPGLPWPGVQLSVFVVIYLQSPAGCLFRVTLSGCRQNFWPLFHRVDSICGYPGRPRTPSTTRLSP